MANSKAIMLVRAKEIEGTVVESDGTYTEGEFVNIGNIYGVVSQDCVAGDMVTLWRRGRFQFTKSTAEALTVGTLLDWVSGGKVVTHSSGVEVASVEEASAASSPTVVAYLDTYVFPVM